MYLKTLLNIIIRRKKKERLPLEVMVRDLQAEFTEQGRRRPDEFPH